MRLGTARALGASSTALDSFERIYHRWIAVQSAFVLIALALPLVRVPAVWMAIALALWGPVMLGSLFFVAGRMTPERIGSAVPHVLTGIRLVTGAGLLIVAAGLGLESARWINGANVEPYSLLSGSEQWWLFGALVVTGLSDFVDGKVARYLGTAGFGSIWDMENDSYFALALSVAAWLVRGLPAFVLLIGAMRYLYFWIVRVHGDPPNHPPSYKLFARSVTAFLLVALIGAFFPPFGPLFRTVIVAVALALQLGSFGWDFVLQFRAGNVRVPFVRASSRESSG